jgi:hypothetical protein
VPPALHIKHRPPIRASILSNRSDGGLTDFRIERAEFWADSAQHSDVMSA